MEKAIFADHLNLATGRVVPFARQFVSDELPDSYLYLIKPNASYDGNPLVEDEVVFPDDSLPEGQSYREPTDAEGVIAFLWRETKVPEWINIAVHHADDEYTYLELRCCGRFTAGVCLYHVYGGIPPFQVVGPSLPKGWPTDRNLSFEEQIKKHGKFKLSRHTSD